MNYKPHWIIVCVWSVLLSVSVLFLSVLKINTFDNYGELTKRAMDTNFDKEFVKQLTSILGDVSGSVIHFEAEDCFCQTVANDHVSSVKKLAINQNFKNHNLVVNNTDGLFLPSVPAVAVINKLGALSYLGPYASGMFCAEGNGLVEPYLIKKNPEHSKLGATIITDAKGCYCSVS
ncbi:DUF6436 domain-containing protein [Pseudoalteromonas sp. G4]|uniref:DUF6436 domain-containing protein n=1 Tax=Pseudoalteromonas sp. G4 TaxID=2992761 RepID=UPI00237E717A|nr:DUF6436 domain-containing protein [Pseudoalteromonas sp. G4]MDE3270992.1 DUF6436 domain-containing protein [Pseudoalteromonas sp. G4]